MRAGTEVHALRKCDALAIGRPRWGQSQAVLERNKGPPIAAIWLHQDQRVKTSCSDGDFIASRGAGRKKQASGKLRQLKIMVTTERREHLGQFGRDEFVVHNTRAIRRPRGS